MSNVIEPIRDKNGKIISNAKVCRIAYKQLCQLRDSEDEKEQLKFYEICNNRHNEIMPFLEQINNCATDKEAQELINKTLLPVVTKGG